MLRHSPFSSYLLLLVFTVTFVSVSSQLFKRLIQNPGMGINYYGKAQEIPPSKKMAAQKAYEDLVHAHCPKSSSDSTCLKDLTYHYPDILDEIENPIDCDYSYPYSRIDGTCNNPHIAKLGMTNQCFERFIPAYYEGDGGFRKSVTGAPLPEPRDLTLKIFKDRHRPTVNITLQFATFGEFVAIDILLAARPADECCSAERQKLPQCTPVQVREDDPFYSQFNVTCIDFHRTNPCGLNPPQRAQLNGVTTAIDISTVYSPNNERSMELRKLDGTGMLKYTNSSVGCLLPSGKSDDDAFCPVGEEKNCFQSGDPRTNHHSIATSMMTIYMREHNRVAKALKEINPHWEEEKLFQEARKITIAEQQSIIYREFLPLVLSPRLMDAYNLTVPEGTKGIQYDPDIILGAWNEFGAATYRLHTLVASYIGTGDLRFRDIYSNPFLLREGHLSQLLRGIHQVPAEQYDRYMVHDITEYLYRQPGVPYGQDLAALNVQRGRDHGLPPYVEIVKFCSEGAIVISSFDDLHKYGLMSKDNADLVQRNYASVHDIDMYVGIQLEHMMSGAVTGPSAACVNAKQFYFNQKGDRFYFDIEGPNAPFTDDQRVALKKSSLSRILCDDADMTQVSKSPFLQPSEENSVVSCEDIPKVDLTLWKEDPKSS